MATPQTEDGYTRIANELVEAFGRLQLSPNESQVLWCILRYTYGWQKKESRITYSTMETFTGIQSKHLARTLKKLVARRVVVGGRGVYTLQKDYDLWIGKGYSLNRESPNRERTTPQSGSKTLPEQGEGTFLEVSNTNVSRTPKEIKESLKEISLRERLLKEMKKIFPALSSIPEFIPDGKLDFLIYKTGKGEVRADSIKNPLAYLKAMTVSEAFPSFLEREAKAEKKRQEDREKREREKEGERQREANLEFNHQKVKELILNLGGKGWKTHTRSDTNIVVR